MAEQGTLLSPVEDRVTVEAKERALLCFRDKLVPGAPAHLAPLQGKGFGRRIPVVEAQGANVFRKAAALAPAAEQGNKPQLAVGSACPVIRAHVRVRRGALLGAVLALSAP
jgi:hypothetical protein